MKLTKENDMRRIFLLIIFFSFTYHLFSQNIVGKWNFQSIKHESIEKGENLKNISEGDALEIRKDGSFHYEIVKEKLIAYGTWQLKGSKLTLHYTSPKDTIRYYQIINDETNPIKIREKISQERIRLISREINKK